MKKVILFAAILFVGVSVMKAENPHTDTNVKAEATTILKIELKTIQSIIVGQADVVFSFASMEDYADPSRLNKDIADHLQIYSTGGFSVTVKQESTDNAGDEIFASFGVQVSDFNENPVYLAANANHALFSQTVGGANLKYGVKYSTTPDYDYMNKIVGGVDTSYETVLTYTIAAK